MLAKIAFGNIRKSLSDFGIYFLTVVLGVAIFYAFNAMSSQESILEFSESQKSMFQLLGILITIASVFIAIVLMFLVVYASRFLMRRRKREMGLYLLLGMSTHKVIKILLIEFAIVGFASIIVGLALGIGLSQVMLYITSMLFQADIADPFGIAFVFSGDAAILTAVLFLCIFVIACILSSISIMRCQLIDLFKSSEAPEKEIVKGVKKYVVIFVLSIALIVFSYWILLEFGMYPTVEFLVATVIVCVGTVLFFWALSGFLVRFTKANKRHYLRDLHMFTSRQVASKINSTFASMAIVCIALFLAITSVCGGIGIRNTLEANLDKATPYSASVSISYLSVANDGEVSDVDLEDSYNNYEMANALNESFDYLGIGSLSDISDGYVQIDYLVQRNNLFTFGDLEDQTGTDLTSYGNSVVNPYYKNMPVYLLRLSQVNDALELAGKDQIFISEGEGILIYDFDITSGFYNEIAASGSSVTIDNKSIWITDCIEIFLETTGASINAGVLVLNDIDIPDDCEIARSILNINCPTAADEQLLIEMLDAVSGDLDGNAWSFTMYQTESQTTEQSVGLAAVVSYIAIYMGFVITISCASILAIQQLSNASDSQRRYKVLSELGASKSQLSRSIFSQVAICFAAPILLALCHSTCALFVITDFVAVFGALDIGLMALMCAAGFLLVYGLYFVITYFASKKVSLAKAH